MSGSDVTVLDRTTGKYESESVDFLQLFFLFKTKKKKTRNSELTKLLLAVLWVKISNFMEQRMT